MGEKSLTKNFNDTYFYQKNRYLLEPENGVVEELRTRQGSLCNLQRILVENVLKDFSESDWKFLL